MAGTLVVLGYGYATCVAGVGHDASQSGVRTSSPLAWAIDAESTHVSQEMIDYENS